MRTTSLSKQKPLNPEIPTEQPSLLYIYMQITNVQKDLTSPHVCTFPKPTVVLSSYVVVFLFVSNALSLEVFVCFVDIG